MEPESGLSDFALTERIKAVHALEILDTPAEQAYDDLVNLAQYVCEVATCVIAFNDTNRFWFKARVGTPLVEIPKELGYGLELLERGEIVIVEDLSKIYPADDPHPLATDPIDYRFFASFPLFSKYGVFVGTLSLLDYQPRVLTGKQKAALTTLASQISVLLNLRTSAQELRHFKDSQQRILAITGHDIKSPLNALQMVLDMRHTGQISEEEMTEMYPLLRQQLGSALRLINNLVQWGQLVVQRGVRYVSTFYLHQEVAHCFEELKDKAEKKNNKLINKVSETELVRADPYATAFILRNLIGNAIKFTKNGSISVSFERHEAGAWLHVEDDGIGMSAQMALHLQRQAVGQQRKGTDGEDGSGLGLALIADYVRSVSGQLIIDSVEGEGTRISVEI